jgi:hypothetical protein
MEWMELCVEFFIVYSEEHRGSSTTRFLFIGKTNEDTHIGIGIDTFTLNSSDNTHKCKNHTTIKYKHDAKHTKLIWHIWVTCIAITRRKTILVQFFSCFLVHVIQFYS